MWPGTEHGTILHNALSMARPADMIPIKLKNATLVAGAPIDAHAVLQHGDRISLGTTKPCTFVLLAVPA